MKTLSARLTLEREEDTPCTPLARHSPFAAARQCAAGPHQPRPRPIFPAPPCFRVGDWEFSLGTLPPHLLKNTLTPPRNLSNQTSLTAPNALSKPPTTPPLSPQPRQARPSSSLEARAPLRQPGGPEERRLRARVREMRLKLGELHPQYLQAVARLASHLEVQGPGSATEAEMLYKEAASGATQWGAEGDFIALPVGAKLGRMYQAQGRLAESEDLFRSTLFGCRRLLGDRNADTLMCATKLARVLLQRGSNGEAEALYREAYEGRIALLGFANRDTVAAAARLARILRDRGAEGEARDIVQKARRGRPRSMRSRAAKYVVPLVRVGLHLSAILTRFTCFFPDPIRR